MVTQGQSINVGGITFDSGTGRVTTRDPITKKTRTISSGGGSGSSSGRAGGSSNNNAAAERAAEQARIEAARIEAERVRTEQLEQARKQVQQQQVLSKATENQRVSRQYQPQINNQQRGLSFRGGFKQFKQDVSSFTGLKERQELKKKEKAFEKLTSKYPKGEGGQIIVPEEDYSKVQGKLTEIELARIKYESAPLIKTTKKVKGIQKKFIEKTTVPGYKVVGGVLIPESSFNNLTQSQQRLVTVAQPEVILLSSQFPSIKDVGVKFAGVKTTSELGNQKTILKFKTSTGEGGGAIGVSKVVGSTDEGTFALTDVIGYKGTNIVDLTRGKPKLSLSKVKKFGSKQASITFSGGDDLSKQISVGKISSQGQKGSTPFISADIGKVESGTTTIYGKTLSKNSGDMFSVGQIKDLSSLTKGSGVNYISRGSQGSITKGISPTEIATQAAVREAFGGKQIITGKVSAPIFSKPTKKTPSVKLEKLKTQQTSSIKQTQVEIPKLKTLSLTKSRTKYKTRQKTQQIQKTKQKIIQKQNIEQIQKNNQRFSQVYGIKTIQKQKAVTPFGFSIRVKPEIKQKDFFYFPKLKPLREKTTSSGGYNVFGRRFGKFKLIGKSKTESGAFSLGKSFARNTLGATFKVPGSRIQKLPGYKTKKTKEGILFIEPLGKRLKKRGVSKEVPEINFYRGVRR